MSRTVSRALVGASILALVVGTPASAFAASHHGRPAKPKTHSKPVKPAKFTLVGVFQSTAGDTATATITVAVKSGHPKEHRTKQVTVKVPATAKVVRNGAKASLASFQKGDKVVVIGSIVGPDLVASHVNAAGRPTVTVTEPDTSTVAVTS